MIQPSHSEGLGWCTVEMRGGRLLHGKVTAIRVVGVPFLVVMVPTPLLGKDAQAKLLVPTGLVYMLTSITEERAREIGADYLPPAFDVSEAEDVRAADRSLAGAEDVL